ncbi:hypothetical protein KIW84_025064 [Lathyrus oleraceus]|uniref:Uncharacterized protein n=1 Tax=Pisum sativum TaxID=3888 RepID=A0A9D5BCU6_PEA|nr:hypothetical protein KIW84_025064 [Pisum sativum]
MEATCQRNNMLHKLHPHLTNPKIPHRYLLVEYHTSDMENLVYPSWQQEDSLLFTWLLTTLLDSNLPRVVKCVHAHEIWFLVDQFQRTELYAKSWKLRYELRYIEKGDHTISQYLETMLLSHEAIFKRALCTPVQELLSMNLTQGNICTTAPTSNSSLSSTLPITQEAKSQMTTHDPVQHFDGAYVGFRSGIFGGLKGGGCKYGGSTCVQCQICFKIGHVARIFYHRHFTQPIPSHLWKNLVLYAICHTPIFLLIQ